jgi:hypothetical protein
MIDRFANGFPFSGSRYTRWTVVGGLLVLLLGALVMVTRGANGTIDAGWLAPFLAFTAVYLVGLVVLKEK